MLRHNRTMFILAVLIALVQVFDIIIHAASNQLEPLRVSANIIILAWLALLLADRMKEKVIPLAVAVLAIYLLHNGIFLALEGVTNPAQGGAFRTMLFLLVGVTLLLSAWLGNLLRTAST